VKPDPPLALATILPFEAPAAGFMVVPVTVMVTPAHGSAGGGSLLLQENPISSIPVRRRSEVVFFICQVCFLKIATYDD
jgi:hypothetical protein